MPLDGSQYSLGHSGGNVNNFEDYDDGSSLSSAPPSIASPNSNSQSPNSAASPGDLSAYSNAASSAVVGLGPGDLSAYTTPGVSMSSGQWANTSLVIQGGLDPIEPFFKTARERNLVSYFIALIGDQYEDVLLIGNL